MTPRAEKPDWKIAAYDEVLMMLADRNTPLWRKALEIGEKHTPKPPDLRALCRKYFALEASHLIEGRAELRAQILALCAEEPSAFGKDSYRGEP